MESQQVVEGGGIDKCECGWDHCCVLSGYLLFFIHMPMKMEPIEGSETSAIRTKTPGNYPKENTFDST